MKFVTLYPILIARSHVVGLPIYMNVSDGNIPSLCIVDNSMVVSSIVRTYLRCLFCLSCTSYMQKIVHKFTCESRIASPLRRMNTELSRRETLLNITRKPN